MNFRLCCNLRATASLLFVYSASRDQVAPNLKIIGFEYISSREQLVHFPLITDTYLNHTPVGVLRWDQNDKQVSGNKNEKLLWHQAAIKAYGINQVCSMGGPWSNALHALGASVQGATIKVLALIRGEHPATPSPTLKDLSRWGVEQYFVSRTQFRALRNMSRSYLSSTSNFNCSEQPSLHHPLTIELIRNLPNFSSLKSSMPSTKQQTELVNNLVVECTLCQHFLQNISPALTNIAFHIPTWWIPEGGDSTLGTWSVAAWAKQLAEYLEASGQGRENWIVPVGSGTTFRGLMAGASLAGTNLPKRIVGVPVYKNALDCVVQTQAFIEKWSLPCSQYRSSKLQWTLWMDHHWGGFGKYPQELASKHRALENELHAPLDRVYTLKLASALNDYLCKQNKQLKQNSSWLFFHTGGLQGNRTLQPTCVESK